MGLLLPPVLQDHRPDGAEFARCASRFPPSSGVLWHLRSFPRSVHPIGSIPLHFRTLGSGQTRGNFPFLRCFHSVSFPPHRRFRPITGGDGAAETPDQQPTHRSVKSHASRIPSPRSPDGSDKQIKLPFPLVIATLCMTGCAMWHPVERRTADQTPSSVRHHGGVTATFLGNTTILVSDGETRLLVDGFFSRPGGLKTLVSKIGPDTAELDARMKSLGIDRVDALLVGHAHHDHALDAPWLSQRLGAMVCGSESYAHVHRGHLGAEGCGNLRVVGKDGGEFRIGGFTVRFVPSDHVSPHFLPQRLVEGEIRRPVGSRAWFHEYKCGQVFALHIGHRQGTVAVTTSAGAVEGQFAKLRADALFLGVGLIALEDKALQDRYWRETADALDPQVLIPVHWDDFSRKIGAGGTSLRPMPRFLDRTRDAIRWVEEKAGKRRVCIMDYGEVLTLKAGNVL